jgi:hypothetical protein
MKIIVKNIANAVISPGELTLAENTPTLFPVGWMKLLNVL